jgi:hypothetical protein
MSDRISVDEYLSGPEDMRRRELVWGVVREPPAVSAVLPEFKNEARECFD